MCNKKRKSLLFYIFRPMGSTNTDQATTSYVTSSIIMTVS